MKGFVRKIDKLGRICLPIEFRRQERLQTDDQVEMIATDDGLLLRKYDGADKTMSAVWRLKRAVIEDGRIYDREKERLLEQMDVLEGQILEAARIEGSGEDDS